MAFNDWCLVRKPFVAFDDLLVIDTPVDVSKWPNSESLLNAGYLRKPENDKDYDKIQIAIKDQKESTEEVDSLPAKRGRKPKGGD
jgi:hypothetical protein